MPKHFTKSLILVALLLLLATLSGCGRKGPLRPLGKPMPAAPPDLVLHQQGGRMLIEWTIPTRNQDGSELKNLEGFRVYRMDYDPAEDCPECRDTSILLQIVDLDYLLEADRSDDRLSIVDYEVEPATGYRYRVAPYTGSGRVGASASARRPFLPPPPAPGRVAGEGLDRLVRLSWEKPLPGPPLAELVGYHVYRRAPGAPFPPRPINIEPAAEPRYEDFEVQNDQPYRYGVRALYSIGGLRVESIAVEIGEIVPREGQ
ncbi:MAG: hypothetical protein C0617_01625 [Desulfuromonas sp.]|uniref:LPS translocon maturation chaperone LptM n=1 Tax=Desulfuromonas sp. TaxID=892 RepID=UPI000CC3D52D|nr:lipoprotein [Desulfuromonas sp.]PLX86304.1 MAG: hypothetical protein C0617_01625 [Desulfuromonas sp.]